ncbi:hypothetical protein [Pseudomonas sp. S35]|uniref:hypothetical protein n=1 Tax=Pseudomonas sp. S35 TaxID=1573719 RepID=UPI0015B4EBB5|nr:hypothetical protein [Pseudomonas sp. S35]
MGKLVDERVVPKAASTQRHDLVVLESTLTDALANMHVSVMLQQAPSALTH